MANLAIASPPPADVDHVLTLAREALGVAERVYGRLMLLEKDPAFFAPRAALATKKLGELRDAFGVPTPHDDVVPSLFLQEAMDMVLEMESNPEIVQSKKYEEQGQFLSAVEALREVGSMQSQCGGNIFEDCDRLIIQCSFSRQPTMSCRAMDCHVRLSIRVWVTSCMI
jgi:hypothetical protein